MTSNYQAGHPVPPSELLAKWEDEILKRYENVDVQLINAYQAGADAELNACCGWIESQSELGELSFIPEVRTKFRCEVSDRLRAFRRQKPPRPKQQALEALELMDRPLHPETHRRCLTIRRALEALPDDN